ncbi:MAG: hypothetical protein P8Y18_04995 [Candidatus Bathyarchaeota archaeon]
MSLDLKEILVNTIKEDYKQKEMEVEKGIERFKQLLCEIAAAKKWDLTMWVEGSNVKDIEKHEKDLTLLEKGKLIKGKMKFTEHNEYREYQLTKKGSDLVKKLIKET